MLQRFQRVIVMHLINIRFIDSVPMRSYINRYEISTLLRFCNGLYSESLFVSCVPRKFSRVLDFPSPPSPSLFHIAGG